jgi:hypothetical protein
MLSIFTDETIGAGASLKGMARMSLGPPSHQPALRPVSTYFECTRTGAALVGSLRRSDDGIRHVKGIFVGRIVYERRR